jgi:two-component system CheB/CheR fusion protein
VDENLDIIQFRGRTGPFLESPPGEPTANILKMAREGLFLELRSALNEAKKTNQPVHRDSIHVRSNGTVLTINLEVVPVRPQAGGTCYLVLFQDQAPPPSPKPTTPPPAVLEGDPAREFAQLRQELSATREYLQSMIEQQDAANEELRSANEEILSSNEELQSTNEELETAKEELQSANEELTTVNEQLQRRNQELDQANNDLSNLLSSTSIPVVMIGADLRVRRFNAPAKKVMNLLPTDVGRPISDLNFSGIVRDLDLLISEVIDNFQPLEREVHDRDGYWYLMRIHPYRTPAHKIDGAVIVLVDIDQVRRAQEQLRQQTVQLSQRSQLIDLSQDAIVVRDSNNRVTSWNRGAQEMYGWSAEEAQGRPLDELLRHAPEDWAELNTKLDEFGNWEGELQLKHKNGTPIVIQSREVLVRDEKGDRDAVLAIERDITERKGMLEALQDADRRKDEFLALLAHELRNPLGAVRNATEIMRIAGADPHVVAQAHEVLDRQVSQLSRIVDDLIDVTRIVEQKIELRKQRVSLSSIVEASLETCRSMIEKCTHRLRVNLPSKPIYLDVDPARMAQVLVNLIDNATKYTNPGGDISLSVKAEDSSRVEIRVRDNGTGIRRELLPHVFEMFTQGVRAPEHGHGGLGVGLTLVRSLVEMHGGDVEARSEGLGKGSEFVVRLPVADGPGTLASPVTATPAKGPVEPRRVLVIDDNCDQLSSLSELLKVLGHDVRVAKDGSEALRIVPEFQPEVVLLDIGLPGMSGYEVARRIRGLKNGDRMVLVAQTGWGQETDRQRSKDSGFDHHLVKPVAVEQFGEILRAAPARPRS